MLDVHQYPASLSCLWGTGFSLAQVAQLVEHILGKDEVTSSILVLGSKRKVKLPV
jgi:hypothetical protein